MNDRQLPPNGFFVYLNEEGDWVMDANRFTKVTVTIDIRREMEENMRDLAESFGYNDYDLNLPQVGETVGRAETARRVFGSLDKVCEVMPTLWGWVNGFEDEIPEVAND